MSIGKRYTERPHRFISNYFRSGLVTESCTDKCPENLLVPVEDGEGFKKHKAYGVIDKQLTNSLGEKFSHTKTKFVTYTAYLDFKNAGTIPQKPTIKEEQLEMFGEPKEPEFVQTGGVKNRQVGGSHYGNGLDVFALSLYRNHDCLQHSAIKYIDRHKLKNGKEDIEKAISILERILAEQYDSDLPF